MPGSGRHGQLDLLQPGVEAVLAAGEPGGHRRHGDLLGLVPGQGAVRTEDMSWSCSLLQQLDALLHPVGVDTHRPRGDARVSHVHRLQQVAPHRPGSLGTSSSLSS